MPALYMVYATDLSMSKKLKKRKIVYMAYAHLVSGVYHQPKHVKSYRK